MNTFAVSEFEACPECDLLLNPAGLEPGHKAHCPRCGYLLHKSRQHTVERSLALSLTGLILIVPANFLPMLNVNILGNSVEGNLWSGVMALFSEELWAVGFLVMLSSVIIPIVNLCLAFAISLHLLLKKSNQYLTLGMRWYQHLNEWAMIEVYALGIIVAWVKLSDDAEVKFGFGLYAFIGLLLVNALLLTELDCPSFWQRISQMDNQ